MATPSIKKTKSKRAATMVHAGQRHPPIAWRGFTLYEWVKTSRVSNLKNDRTLAPAGLMVSVNCNYMNGKPYKYAATIRMQQVQVEVFSYDNWLDALEGARGRVMALSNQLNRV